MAAEKPQAHGLLSAVHVMEALLWGAALVVLCCSPAVLTCPGGPACPVAQSPRTLFLNGPNSSAEFLCSTSRPKPAGLYLYEQFHGNRAVAYLNMVSEKRETIADKFKGRLAMVAQPEDERGCAVALKLSWLRAEDTDSYRCTWIYFDINAGSELKFQSEGTVIIVRERDPNDPCWEGLALDLTLIVLSLLAFVVALFIFVGVLVSKCKMQRKGHFTPGRASSPSRPGQTPSSARQNSLQQPTDTRTHSSLQPLYLMRL